MRDVDRARGPQSQNWQYPSQQMFYNAMERKGHNPSEELMPVVVGMHNAVNERSWGQLLEWERTLHPETAESVRLKRFHGDATNISPKVAHAVAPFRVSAPTAFHPTGAAPVSHGRSAAFRPVCTARRAGTLPRCC